MTYLPLALVCLSVLSIQNVLGCEDGVDNVLHVYDLMKGKGAASFEDIEILTYDKNKNPSCEDGKAVFNFPGFFKFRSGKIVVNEPVSEKQNRVIKMEFTLEKNSWIVGKVCHNGKSKNSFVPDEICSISLCQLAPEKCEMLSSIGEYDLVEETKALGTDGLIDMGPLPVPQISGEWSFSIKFTQGTKKLAELSFNKKGEWLNTAADELNMADMVKETFPAGPAPPGANVVDHSEL